MKGEGTGCSEPKEIGPRALATLAQLPRWGLGDQLFSIPVTHEVDQDIVCQDILLGQCHCNPVRSQDCLLIKPNDFLMGGFSTATEVTVLVGCFFVFNVSNINSPYWEKERENCGWEFLSLWKGRKWVECAKQEDSQEVLEPCWSLYPKGSPQPSRFGWTLDSRWPSLLLKSRSGFKHLHPNTV